MIFHYDCMYVILKNHRIKESICHSIPRALKAKFYNCISPSGRIGGGAGGGVVQVAFFRRITKFLIKFFPEKFKVISWINP